MARRLSYTYDNHTMISKHRTNLLTRKVSYRGCPWSAHPRTDHGFGHGNTWDSFCLDPSVHFGPWAVKCFVRNNHSGDLDAQFMKERICNGRGQNYHKVKSYSSRMSDRGFKFWTTGQGPAGDDPRGIIGLKILFYRSTLMISKTKWIKLDQEFYNRWKSVLHQNFSEIFWN